MGAKRSTPLHWQPHSHLHGHLGALRLCEITLYHMHHEEAMSHLSGIRDFSLRGQLPLS